MKPINSEQPSVQKLARPCLLISTLSPCYLPLKSVILSLDGKQRFQPEEIPQISICLCRVAQNPKTKWKCQYKNQQSLFWEQISHLCFHLLCLGKVRYKSSHLYRPGFSYSHTKEGRLWTNFSWSHLRPCTTLRGAVHENSHLFKHLFCANIKYVLCVVSLHKLAIRYTSLSIFIGHNTEAHREKGILPWAH